MIQFEKLLESAKLTTEANERLTKMERQLNLVRLVLPVIKTFSGKKISKRVASAVEKLPELEGYTVSYSTNYGMFHLEIWGKELPYSERFSLLLCYDSDPIIDYEKLETNYAQCYLLNEERIQRLRDGLPRIPGYVQRWNDAMKALQAVQHEADQFGLGHSFDTKVR